MLTHLTCVTLFVSSVVGKILYAGVAESGGEFGVFSSSATPGTGLPGRFDVDYAFINEVIPSRSVPPTANDSSIYLADYR